MRRSNILTTYFREFDSCRLLGEVFDGIECIPSCNPSEYTVNKVCTAIPSSVSSFEARFTLNSTDQEYYTDEINGVLTLVKGSSYAADADDTNFVVIEG